MADVEAAARRPAAAPIRQAIAAAIAPEVDFAHVRPDADLRDELDIDSMDFLRFVVGLHERLGVDVPEADYPRIRTLDGCVAYLDGRVSAVPAPSDGGSAPGARA